MSRKKKIALFVVVGLVATLALLCGTTIYIVRLPRTVSDQETIVLGQTRFAPGSRAAMRIAVRDTHDNSPVADATIAVSLVPASGGRGLTLFEGTTDELGTAEVAFHVPEEAEPAQTLVVEVRSALGRDRVERPVTIERDYRVLLTTDKPIYQPGQTIYIRALTLSTFDLRPAAGQEIVFVVTDARGNKVFRETAVTSEYGIAATDFTLAREVNTGRYNISVTLGDTSSERSVTVEHYVLPKFRVQVTTDRSFYLPGERVTGRVNAAYFFGRAVEEGQVELTGYVFDIERQQVLSLQGTTDSEGVFEFEFDLPDYFVSGLESHVSTFILEAAVTDQAQHTEQVNIGLPVAQQRIVIEAVPESGELKPGVENILYVITAYPDGSPAACDLAVNVNGVDYQASTGDYGLGELRFVPDRPGAELTIAARDAQGNEATTTLYTEGEWTSEYVLLRPERAMYRVGDTMVLEVLTSADSGAVYLDIVREGQTVSTRALQVKDGRAEAAVDLTEDLFGTLELRAYKILSMGEIVRDTRLVVVDAPRDLTLAVVADRDEYRPGDTAAVDFDVSDPEGTGVPSALGIAVVDESVFAVQEQDPGFAKLYFLLERELLQPRYDVHGLSLPGLMTEPADEPALRETQDRSARALLAGAGGTILSPMVNSRQENLRRAEERVANYFTALSRILFAAALLIPVVIVGLALAALAREKVLGRGIALGVGAVGWLVVILLLLPAPEWVETPLERLGYWLEEAFESDAWIVGGLLLAGLVAFIGLAVRAWRRAEGLLGSQLLLYLTYTALLPLLAFAALTSGQNPDGPALIALLVAYLLIPTGFLLRSAGYGARRQGWAAAGMLTLSGFALAGTLLPVVALASASSDMMLGAAPRHQRLLRGGAPEMWGMEMQEEALMMATPVPAIVSEDGRIAEMTASEPPRLRQFFPETLFWLPEVVTDEKGHARVLIPMADSITTWRLSALASSQDGRLGATTVGLRVFQDFFIDLDLPVALTQNDEVSVPVAVFNYLPESQAVRLELAQDDWFTLLDEAEKELTIGANDVEVVYFRLRATRFGRHALQVTAWGERMSDAIQKEVTVHPDGLRFDFAISDRLEVGTEVETAIPIPAQAIPGTARVDVKIYPGIVSQVVEGLDSILRMPYGCFEQTTSTTYPNVLVMDYMRSTGQATPEILMKAEEYINLGYQRLTTFEVDGGGFSLFGDAPADRMLTAYGLQEFSDMARVHAVDEAIIERAAQWLLAQQSANGSWEPDQGLVHEDIWVGLDRLPVTAYVVWSLVDAGYGDDPRVEQGLSYVREFRSQGGDAYVLALVANALVAGTPDEGTTQQALDALAEAAVRNGNVVYWPSGVATMMGSRGETGSIETTALAAYALIRAGAYPDLANGALTYLMQHKDSHGTWYSTQATILSLKALLLSVHNAAERVDATVRVSFNGRSADPIRVTTENYDVVQVVSFDDISADTANSVHIRVEGEGNLMYQVAGSYYLPWADVPPTPAEQELITIDVDYDRRELTVNDTVEVGVTVALNQPGGVAEWVLVDLGVPPGFQVLAEDLNALVARDTDRPADYEGPRIKRYELTGRQVLVYVEGLSEGLPLTFRYRLRARYPIVAQTPASRVYDYYNPDVADTRAPQTLTVLPTQPAFGDEKGE